MLKCKNCIHFKPPRYNIDFASSTGTCKKFSKKYEEFADTCRIDPSKCGKDGKYFEKEPHLYTKMIKHHLLYVAPFWASLTVTVVFMFPVVELILKLK
jgi:hypothetical protein